MAFAMSSLTTRAIRLGLIGGHTSWRLLLVAIGLIRLFRFLSSGRPRVLRTAVEPGETLEVRHLLEGTK